MLAQIMHILQSLMLVKPVVIDQASMLQKFLENYLMTQLTGPQLDLLVAALLSYGDLLKTAEGFSLYFQVINTDQCFQYSEFKTKLLKKLMTGPKTLACFPEEAYYQAKVFLGFHLRPGILEVLHDAFYRLNTPHAWFIKKLPTNLNLYDFMTPGVIAHLYLDNAIILEQSRWATKMARDTNTLFFFASSMPVECLDSVRLILKAKFHIESVVQPRNKACVSDLTSILNVMYGWVEHAVFIAPESCKDFMQLVKVNVDSEFKGVLPTMEQIPSPIPAPAASPSPFHFPLGAGVLTAVIAVGIIVKLVFFN